MTTGTSQPTAAAGKSNSRQSYVGVAIALVLAGCLLAWWADQSPVTYTVVETVSVFAVLYVLAQGIERLVELVVGIVDAVTPPDRFAETRKNKALADVKTAADKSDSDKAAAKQDVDDARGDLTILTQGLSFGLSIIAVSYIHYGLLENIGTTNVNAAVDRVFTALAIMGGSKGLHDLISKVQKSKESDEAK